ncbi:MAG: asparagine synthase (glutamine-hydrolyzing) [Candidatus Acidiferrales bacterium]
MCGIGGIATRNLTDTHVAASQAMAVALSHRGPDSHGVEVIGNCALANTRLAILDLSERGRQPMPNTDRSSWITYNGECYNAAELREWLLARGHRFHSTTDTEVVLHLYDELGEACVERLRGMFSFAIWDSRKSQLLLARDRLGIKPLYYAPLADGVVFASEIKALLACDHVARRVDAHGIRAFLQLGHIPPPWTAIRGVQPLEPGHIAFWKDGSFQKKRYWRLEPHRNGRTPQTPEQIAGTLSDSLVEATRLHLISDVPVALFLSGGVDSAALGVLAQLAGAERLTALTIGFEEKSFDESAASQRTAQLLGIPHNVLTLPAREIRDSLDHAIWAMDEPTVDGLNAYWICRTAARAGFKVALTGQGGDELFGGYASLPWFERFTKAATWLQPVPRGLAAAMLDHDSLPFRWRKLSYLAGADDPFVAAELAVKIHFLNRDVDALVGPPLVSDANPNGAGARGSDEASAHLSAWAADVKGFSLLEKVAYLDFHAHLEPRLLRDGDAMSMAHSLELRPVFLDHKLVEYVFSLPAALRMQKKKLLLDAMRRVMSPAVYQEIVSRPKQTFSFPFAQWLAGDLRQVVEDAFRTERLEATGVLNPPAVQNVWRRFLAHPHRVGWSRPWGLFVLQRWCETMGVSQ